MFFDIPKGTKLILYGENVNIKKYKEMIDKFFMDYIFSGIADTVAFNNKEYIRGLPIVPSNEWESLDGVVVLFGDNWFKEAEELRQEGYVLIRDFVPAWFFEIGYKQTCISYNKIYEMTKGNGKNIEKFILYMSYVKPIATVYGDEQVPMFMKVLSRTKELTEKYVFLSLLPIENMQRRHIEIPEKVWHMIRLIWIQKTDITENSYSIDYVKTKLKQNCKKFIFMRYEMKNFFENLNREYNEEDDCENIKTVISESIKNNYIEWKLKEENCDLKAADWIIENFDKIRMFDTDNCPNVEIWKKLIRETLKKNGYNKKINIDTKNIKLNIEPVKISNRVVKNMMHFAWE